MLKNASVQDFCLSKHVPTWEPLVCITCILYLTEIIQILIRCSVMRLFSLNFTLGKMVTNQNSSPRTLGC